MTKVLDDVVAEARLMLKDNRAPFRYTQAQILDSINSAFQEARRLRGDLFSTGYRHPDVQLIRYSEAHLGQTPETVFPINPMYFMAIVYFVVGKLQLGDDEFTLDNRAMTLLSEFRRQLARE